MSKTDNEYCDDEYERRYREYYNELADYESQDDGGDDEYEPYMDPAFNDEERLNGMFFRVY